MNLKKKIAHNVIWNWGGTVTHMAAGFITFPILIHRLGQSDCGLWLVILSVTELFNLLDLGLRGALGRNIAFCQAKGDGVGVNRVFNTGLVLLLVGAGLVLLVTAGVQLVFCDLFDVRPEAQADVRLAVGLVGLNLALVFFFSGFESVLWAFQRFDLINRVDIPCLILRTVLTIALIGGGSENLVTLALILVAITVLRGVSLGWLDFVVQPGLRVGWRFVRFDTGKELFDFGIWCFLISVANIAAQQLGPSLIGNRFGPGRVPPFSAASRLVNYVKTFLTTSTGVLMPMATAWHAAEERAKQRWLFVSGGKFCMALGLFFLGGFWFLGAPFLRLWTHTDQEFVGEAWTILMILGLGELLPMSQWVTYGMVMSMNRHRVWAVMSIVEVFLVLGLAVVLLHWDSSVLSIALAIALPGALGRGLIQWMYACRLLQVSMGEYLRKAYLPTVLAAAGPILLLGLLTTWHTPENWFTLLGVGFLYALGYVGVAGFFLVGPAGIKSLVHALLKKSPSKDRPVSVLSHGEPDGDETAVALTNVTVQNEPAKIY